MMRGCLFGTVAICLLASPLRAQSPDRYETLVQALAHPRYQEREKAARDLLAAGEPALNALRAGCASSDPELRTRATALVEKIESAVRSERLLAAPKIALKLDKVPLQQAVIDIGRKTGLRFQLEPSKDADFRRPVTIDTGELPFWEAVQAFYDATGLAENDSPPSPSNGREVPVPPSPGFRSERRGSRYGPGGVRLVASKESSACDCSKALRVRALPATFAQNRFDAATGEMRVFLDVDAAPTLSVQEIIGVEARRAIGNHGHALALEYPAGASAIDQLLVARQVLVFTGDVENDVTTGSKALFPVTLKTGGTRPRQLAELAGVVVARVIAPPESLLTVDDIFGKGKGQTRTAGGLSMTVLSAEEGARSGEAIVRIRVESSPDSINEVLNFPVQVKGRMRPFVRINRRRAQTNPNVPEFRLSDAHGAPLRITATQLFGQKTTESGLESEYRLTLQEPAESGSKDLNAVQLAIRGRKAAVVEMPFVLKNVPLP